MGPAVALRAAVILLTSLLFVALGRMALTDATLVLWTTGAAFALLTATHFGVPVSTTHAITGAIVGVGATRRFSAVRWGIAGQILWAWVLTIPAAFLIGAGTFTLLRLAGAR